VGSDDPGGLSTLLNPFGDGSHLIEGIWPGPIFAVPHPWKHEERKRALRIGPDRPLDVLKEEGAVFSRHLRVVPAVPRDQFAPAIEERLQVEVHRRHESVVHPNSAFEIGCDVRKTEDPSGIFEMKIANPRKRVGERFRATQSSPSQFSAWPKV
jgi:hypothetical protein